MNSESRIGSALMSRRIELGISLDQAGRDTNIRARMLEVIESGDYAKYPPRGYAIGMLSSYARYLGLDSAAIVELFDTEFEAFNASQEIHKSASNTRRGVGRFGERAANAKSRPTNRESSRTRSQRPRRGDEPEIDSKLSRNLRDEASAKDDERYRSGSVRVLGTRQTGSFTSVSPRTRRPSSSDSPGASSSFERTRTDTGSIRVGSETGSFRRSRPLGEDAASHATEDLSQAATKSAPNFFGVDVDTGAPVSRNRTRTRSATRASSARESNTHADENIVERATRVVKSIFNERRTRLIAIAFIAIALAIIIAASVLISTAGHGNGGVIAVSGGATNDTMMTDGENAAHKTITTANGNPVILKIEVAPGETSLAEITCDGAIAYKGTAMGGQFSREYPVTESFMATFSNPDAVTATENNNPIEIAKSEDGKSGSLYISVQTAPK